MTNTRETKDVNIFYKYDVKECIDILYKKGIELNHCNKMIDKGNLPESKHNEYCNKDFELSTWFANQYKDAKNIFLQYLNFKSK